MKRRDFLKLAGASASLAALAPKWAGEGIVTAASASPTEIYLSIEETVVEMIDGEPVFMLAFKTINEDARVPGPVLQMREGDEYSIVLFNNSRTPHKFAVPGVPRAVSGTVAPQQSTNLTFTAPVAGTYLYLDPLNAPVNRMLGLHGVLIVEPREGRTAAGVLTPYSASTHTTDITLLFEAFGPADGRFPGDPWHPNRQLIWVFHQIDPRYNRMARRGESINASEMSRNFLGRYFTINGVSGFEAAHDPSVVATGFVGEPMLIRTVNAGLNWLSPHIHGNHVFELTTTAASLKRSLSDPQEPASTLASAADDEGVILRQNILHRDVWTMGPLDRKDILLPYERPPDIPEAAYPPRQETEQTLAPLRYVMHDHTEVSLTAAGGNYPQGLMAHWEVFPREMRTLLAARGSQ